MAHLVEDITKFFIFEDIDIDNWHFKLYSKGCVIFFFAGSMVGVMSQYFGEPIQCDFKGVDGETAKDYCWIHGSSYIPPEYQRHMRCIAEQEGLTRKEDAFETSYYQWVTFMMLLQAGMFMLPPRIWRSLEGKLIESFGMEGKSVVMLTDEAKYEDGIVMEVVVEKFVKYFTTVLHHNQIYFAHFVMCEFFNFILVFFNFWATDQFLAGKFRYFGAEVIAFYAMSRDERKGAINPFCAVFPKEVSCDMPTIGPAGREQWHNGLCVMSQNVINEKIYLALWFYLVFVMVSCLLFMFYRVATIFCSFVRFYVIYARISHRYDGEIRKSLKFVLDRCYLGDWFVLQQLCRNVNVYFFREFIKQLRSEMAGNPKGGKGGDATKEDLSPYFKERTRFSSETRIDVDPLTAAPSTSSFAQYQAPDPEKEKSGFLLRLEHEQRLMPGRRGKRSARGNKTSGKNRRRK